MLVFSHANLLDKKTPLSPPGEQHAQRSCPESDPKSGAFFRTALAIIRDGRPETFRELDERPPSKS